MAETTGTYMGYGSPQALEAALNIDNEHFQLIRESICNAQVCSNLSQDEVVKRMASRISGTRNGWRLAGDIDQGVLCSERPGFKHYLFQC